MFLTEKHTFPPASRVHEGAQVQAAGELSSPEDHDLVNGGAGCGGVDVNEDDREEVVDCPTQLICTWIFICCVP